MKVLLLEDDVELGAAVVDGLRDEGFVVDHVGTLRDADLQRSVTHYDCLVLDRMVPDGDAVALVDALRRAGDTTPTLLLTARDRVSDRVAGFEHGADDYLVKPFAFAELTARIRALGRRAADPAPPVLRVGDLELDTARHEVHRGGEPVSLTAKEFTVLEVLLTAAGRVVGRTELLERGWDEMSAPGSNVVDVLVGQLRRRLGSPDPIETVRGVGYRVTG
ncbi:winged helix-turn-helix domain-containing protein [Curtobacterium sp. SP.BCp]|uniref:winged helix-turn-helix domain-containing protein n=1 Tax=unclassified Curtobacterium TaxID=257496 RepID=UPI0025B5EB81|nr:response regulator transcription factor [Curtobacterium sp. 458]WJX99555.1 response regulator transcription factor [Curtobacterium sp. 458]